jgi:hypothetical protein
MSLSLSLSISAWSPSGITVEIDADLERNNERTRDRLFWEGESWRDCGRAWEWDLEWPKVSEREIAEVDGRLVGVRVEEGMIWIDAGRLTSTRARLDFDRGKCKNEASGGGPADWENEPDRVEFLFVVEEEKSDDAEAEEIDDNENRFEGGRRDEELL